MSKRSLLNYLLIYRHIIPELCTACVLLFYSSLNSAYGLPNSTNLS